MIQDLVPAPNYCHWLLDQLPRTRHLNDAQHLIMHKLAPFMKSMLDLIGIAPERVIELNRSSVVRVRHLAIDSSMARHFYHPCQETNAELIDHVRTSLKVDAVVVPGNRRRRNVYVSRNRSSRRRISNEAELLQALDRYEFDVVYLEELSVSEQISVFKNAAVIVAPHGAGLSNAIFCDQASIVEIFNPNYGTASFRLLAQLLGLGYQHVMGNNPVLSESERHRAGRAQLQREDIEVDITRLIECLEKVFSADQ